MEKISRKRNRYATLLLGCVAVLSCAPARAQEDQSQQETIALPDINVTNTRLLPGPSRAPSRSRTPARAPAPVRPAAEPGDGESTSSEAVSSSGIVSGTIITGASTSIITSADIERSPSATLQDILAREPGVQTTNLFGSVNGAGTTVDLRGFGANGASNTLVLINGRRLNDIDMAGVDFSAIPKNSIERIEITRGNSGAVLYGDGAVGGVINVITKTGVGLPPSARIQGTFGSYHYVEGNVSANTSATNSSGNWATSAYANAVSAHGYRDNNQLRQENAVGDVRWNNGQGTTAYLNLAGDNQHNGLPGGLRVSPTFNQLLIDPRAAATPFDFANKEGMIATLGVTHMLWQGTDLIVDGSIRQKNQQAAFFCGPFCSDFDRGFKATLTAASFTPRLTNQHNLGGVTGKLIAGVDLYDTTYGSDRSLHLNDAPIHRYDLTQATAAGYFQETLALLPTTDFAFGGRVQGNNTTARDKLDLAAPGALFPDPQGVPLDQTETQYAWHLGLEHRLNDNFALFGRAARSFRLPTVDERVGMAPSGFGIPTNFDLKTQTSHDVEGGARLTYGAFTLQSNVYDIELTDELFFSPASFTNTNLDPTRRYGFENIAGWNATDALRFKAGLAYTRSVFREGPFAGNDVPLVSRWTGSGGVSWDIYKKYVTFDAVARVFGPRRMDNDSANLQVEIPGQTIIDLRIGGEYQNVFWSLSVQNLFDVHYFEYAISALTFTTPVVPVLGTYNAYPLPGRTVMAKAGMTW
jgi:iron complex outermembrane receptor protein